MNRKEVWRNGKSVSLLMLLLANYFSFFFLKMWTILKVFIEFVTMLLLFYVGPEACGILALPPGVQPAPPGLEGTVFHWTAREVPENSLI